MRSTDITTNNKKNIFIFYREGKHHEPDEREKTRHLFWAALLLLLILLVPGHVVCVQAASDQTTVELKLSQGTRRYDYAYRVLDLVNQERAKKNLSPVTMDKNLLECAMTRAEDTDYLCNLQRIQLYEFQP